jgi:hypothetical protein
MTGRRVTQFRDREDGMVERWVGREGEHLTLDSVFDPDYLRPRPEDAYALKPPHLPECRAIPVGPQGHSFAFLKCAKGCPELQAALDRGEELAKEHGW